MYLHHIFPKRSSLWGVLVVLLLCSFTAPAQNVEEFFGEDYGLAKKFLYRHKSLVQHYSDSTSEIRNKSERMKSAVFSAIVFPELVRLSRFRDFIETTALEYAYTSGGKDVANFSIGPFQMRPSFVEDLEAYVRKNKREEEFSLLFNYSSSDDIRIRGERVERLKQLNWQLYYLQVFFVLAEEIVQDKTFSSDLEYVGFMAAFYNYGLTTDLEKIKNWQGVKAFPMGSQFKGKQFSYSEVAQYFFLNDALKLFEGESVDE